VATAFVPQQTTYAWFAAGSDPRRQQRRNMATKSVATAKSSNNLTLKNLIAMGEAAIYAENRLPA
jgi:hypothetical protein